MASTVAKQVRYGKSCLRCKAYFVTTDAEQRICPWCQRIEVGTGIEESYETPEQ
jgi:RNA polymerase subunit RPABC4/transcription elongation factor Spt4